MKTSYTSIATILLVASASSEAARPSSMNFIETSLEVEGNKCDCNTADDCGDNEHCKQSNCHDNEGLVWGHCKPNDLNFMETSLEGNKCDCNTAADCGYNEHCKPSNCHETEGLSYGHCKPNEGPPPPPQCYNLGEPCNKNSDCWQGGTNFCSVCGDEPGTDNHKTCYNPPPEPPTPSPDVGQCGIPCNNNNDCKSEYVGTYNPCVVCSRYTGDVGTQWVCVEPEEAEAREEEAKYLRGK